MSAGHDAELLPSDVIEAGARLHGDRVAVVCEQEQVTWRELDARTAQVANALAARGVQPGEKVAQLQLSSIDTFVTFWGILRAGCCAVPLNVMLDPSALTRLLNDSDARTVLADADTRARLDAIRSDLVNVTPKGFLAFGGAPAGWASAEAMLDAAPTTRPAVHPRPEHSMTILYTSGRPACPRGSSTTIARGC
jgi:acyl-CoA synthetase (AMP-forming)/AMP-acid ligase II